MSVCRLSFLALMLLVCVSLLIGTTIRASAVPQQPPIKDLKFKQLGSWKTHKVEVAPETRYVFQAEDGEYYAGAVFRMTPTTPQTIEKLTARSFVNIILTKCGSDNVLLVKSTIIGTDGREYPQEIDPKVYPVEKKPDSSAAVSYGYLCNGVGTVTPFGSATWV